MTQNILKLAGSLFITFSMTAAFASGVDSCKNDAYTQERINEEIPAEDRLAVFNDKNEVVGAFGYHVESGDIYVLYLCGRNSGYYYAEGNAYDGSVDSVYNDEYDSEVNSEDQGPLTKVILENVTFAGEPEYADYKPFSAVFFFQTPAR